MITTLTQLSRGWWRFAVRGGLAILFGILALTRPESTMLTLVLLFGAFALVDGLFTVAISILSRKYLKQWWVLLLEGLTGIVIAALTFAWPDVTALVLLYFIAAWAILSGIFEIMAAIELRNVIVGESVIMLFGLLSIVLGVLLFAFPEEGAVSLAWAIGFYAIFAGIMEIAIAFRLRGLGRQVESKQTSPANA
jgi:uncharacterized membrane protein HdeD (DUF308 family)